MNRIISILLSIIVIQLLLFSYIKFAYETKKPAKESLSSIHPYVDPKLELLVKNSIQEIIQEAKTLPQSKAYTEWDKQTLATIDSKLLQQQKIKESKIINPKIVKISQKNQKIDTIQKEIQTLVEGSLHKTNIKTIKTATVTTPLKLSKRVLKKIPKKPSILQKIEKYAKAKLGDKYVWGATGPNKFDCSGFTKEVFHSTVGINIPRVSREQAKVGKFIKFKDLKRGDMVFFDTEKKFTKRVNHVGIYLSNGNFIHASSAKKKVIITSFRKKPFYKKRFLWGRRVINSKS